MLVRDLSDSQTKSDLLPRSFELFDVIPGLFDPDRLSIIELN